MLESLGLQTIPAEEGGTSSQSAASKTLGEASMKGPTAAPLVKKGTVHNPEADCPSEDKDPPPPPPPRR